MAVGNNDLNLTGATIQAVAGGTHYPVTLNPWGRYVVDSDIDVWLSNGNGTALTYLPFAQDADALHGTSGDLSTLISGNALDFGANGLSLEFWVRGVGSGQDAMFAFGDGAGTLVVVRTDLQNSDTEFEMSLAVDSDDNSSLISTGDQQLTNSYNPSLIYHAVIVLDRTNDSCVFYCNGVQAQKLTSQGMDSDTVNASSITSSGIVTVAGTGGAGAANWQGDVFAIRAYKSALTSNQVQHRTNLGPAVLPADGNSPSFILSMANQASWASSSEPEAVDVTGSPVYVFDDNEGLTLPGDIATVTGNVLASTSIHPRVKANHNTLISAGNSGIVNIYTKPQASGDVRFYPV